MNNQRKLAGENPQGPKPLHRFPIMPKFSISKTSRHDYHAGAIARYIHDYAQDDAGKYSAAILVIAVFRYIVQIGVTINKGKPNHGKELNTLLKDLDKRADNR
jgi:hypothetical protein